MCRVDEHEYYFALVQSLEKKIRQNMRPVDRSLSISRWHIWPQNRCEVIPLDCIVHGAVLVVDTKYVGDYFVINMLDKDMYLRVNSMS